MVQKHLLSRNAIAKAVKKLERTTYYQENYIVKKYSDKFQTLILEANYTDFYIIVVKFHYRLRITIQN